MRILIHLGVLGVKFQQLEKPAQGFGCVRIRTVAYFKPAKILQLLDFKKVPLVVIWAMREPPAGSAYASMPCPLSLICVIAALNLSSSLFLSLSNRAEAAARNLVLRRAVRASRATGSIFFPWCCVRV
jgi:hypothetical protein